MVKETEQYEYLYCNISDDILRKRIQLSLNYFIEQARIFKSLGLTFSILGIVLPAIGTVLAGINISNGWVIGVSATTTVVSALLALLKCNDKKDSYRNSAENLKRELILYSTEQESYKRNELKDGKDKEAILVEHIEKIIEKGYNRISELEKKALTR